MRTLSSCNTESAALVCRLQRESKLSDRCLAAGIHVCCCCCCCNFYPKLICPHLHSSPRPLSAAPYTTGRILKPHVSVVWVLMIQSVCVYLCPAFLISAWSVAVGERLCMGTVSCICICVRICAVDFRFTVKLRSLVSAVSVPLRSFCYELQQKTV